MTAARGPPAVGGRLPSAARRERVGFRCTRRLVSRRTGTPLAATEYGAGRRHWRAASAPHRQGAPEAIAAAGTASFCTIAKTHGRRLLQSRPIFQ
ncbi:hypothetical protein BOC39_01740 [Burkholderia pseudomallei]|nr:hypothetical protein BOC39_01740 [Burkholderia pseudomallei]